jgi:hypothetical protein
MIFSDSTYSIKEFALSMLVLKYKHKLSESSINDILKFLNIILPQPNKCPKTFNSLLRMINIDIETKSYLICSNKSCEQIQDFNKVEKCNFCNSEEPIEFVTFNIIPQIKNIISQSDYFKQIKNSNH